MHTFRPTDSPVAVRIARLIFALVVTLLAGSGFFTDALAEDQVGIYWDTDYSQDSLTTDTYPSYFTGYLVLKDPSTPSGILGWELCADVDGPAEYLGWNVMGQAINAATPPCFAVGISPVPLPSDEDVLLATFQIMVTDPLPVYLSLRPDYSPSVPDQMSFIPGDDPGALLPLTTVTGQPEVAWINAHIPNLVVSPITLHFENTYIGSTNTQIITVTNNGSIPGNLDVALSGDCDPFSLPGVSGPVTVPAGQSLDIEVAFSPTTTEFFICNVSLGAMLDDVQMVGSGIELDAEWEAPTEVFFGPVAVGSYSIRVVRIRNTGDVPFEIDPSLPATCPEFFLSSGDYPSTIQPGSSRTLNVTFTPSAVGSFDCMLDLGNVVPAVALSGIGRDPQYDWSIFPLNLDFGTVGIGYSQSIGLNIQNTGDAPILVTPEIPAECPEFAVTSNQDPFEIMPGNSAMVEVTFTPQEVSQVFCDLSLGDIISDVPMTGIGRQAILSWLAPTSHDFGVVPVGQVDTYSFQVFNNGDIPFLVDPSLPADTQNFQLVQGSTVTLVPGSSALITVSFRPLVPGPDAVALDLGPTVPPVQFTGIGEAQPEMWLVSPNPLDFGWLYVGTYLEKDLRITNSGGTFLDLDIYLENPDLGYSIIDGAGPVQLPPSYFHDLTVRFQPQSAGFFPTQLNIGGPIPPVAVIGGAETTDNVCLAEPDSLIFGPISMGDDQTKFVQITNTGNQTLTLTPNTHSAQFICTDWDRDLAPGHSAYFSVTFSSSTPGTFTDTLDLGDQACQPVPLVGTAAATAPATEDLVGIFFDTDYTNIEAETFNPNEVVTGYLVLTEPSVPTGVSAWELKADIDGDGVWLQWDIEGQHINAGQGNEFIVGIGGSPLPPSDAILLATFQILIAEPYPNIVYLELGPIQQPSLPNQMVWAPGDDSSNLLPMFPLTGDRIVAGINWGPPVGIGNPPPRATVTGGAVELMWPAPADPGEGCHVYRREESGTPLRLTDQPLDGYGSNLTYTDRPQGYTSGTVLYYSYSVVNGGIEGPPSLETEVKLAGTPAVQTRLLPNVPNPFNPLTEIRFELSEPQQVRVIVYDVTGRLVKVLAEGQLGSGLQTRIWQGRDSAGRQVPSGAYYVRLVADGKVDHQKIMLLK